MWTRPPRPWCYAKYSPYAVGTHAQGDAVTGEALNLSRLPGRATFSSDGIRMTERPLLENGVVKGIYHGATRFCRLSRSWSPAACMRTSA